MTSILTNSGAMGAVDQLRSIVSSRASTQQEIATGLRVKTASDNTAYWSIATTMRSDNRALAAAEDSLSFGAAAVGVAYYGMESSMHVVEEIKKKLVSAREAGVSYNKIDAELVELREELYTIVDGAQFNGENWLLRRSAVDDRTREVVASFARDAFNNVSIKTLDYSLTDAMGTRHLIDEDSQLGILTNADYATALGAATDWVLIHGRNTAAHTEFRLDDTTTMDDVDEMIGVINAMQLAMTDTAAGLGSLMARIDMQQNFVVDLQDTQDRGVGRLVDSDLNSATARLRAVEVQRQLATEALSIANDSPLTMLRLLG